MQYVSKLLIVSDIVNDRLRVIPTYNMNIPASALKVNSQRLFFRWIIIIQTLEAINY